MRAMRSLVRPVRIMSWRNIAVSCDSFGRLLRPEDDVRRLVEFVAAGLEQIRQVIDQFFENADEGKGGIECLMAGQSP